MTRRNLPFSARILFARAAILALGGCHACPHERCGDSRTPASEAKAPLAPIALPGVPNLYRVDDRLYRSAQPSAAGMQLLEDMGIATVINLRSFHSDRDELAGTSLGYEHIWVKAWHPEEKEVVRFLEIVTDPVRGPVLVHCMHGADRTGLMVAVYRVAIEGWSKEDAIREWVCGPFGFHAIFGNLVAWFEDLDIDRLRERARIAESKRATRSVTVTAADPGTRGAP